MESQVTWCTHCFNEVDIGKGEGVVIEMARMTLVLCRACAEVVVIKIAGGLHLDEELKKASLADEDNGKSRPESPEDSSESAELDKLLADIEKLTADEEKDEKEDKQETQEDIPEFAPEAETRRREERLREIREQMRRFTPPVIQELLDRDVIGHAAAKRTLAVAANNHLLGTYCRLADAAGELGWLALEAPDLVDVVPEKSNVLLVGPTGSGKTLLARKLSEILELPMISVAATRFTERGYVGESLDAVFQELFRAADYETDRAAEGIVYLDEFDKLARRDEHRARDISGLGVQQELLRLIEGEEVSVRLPGEKVPVSFSTENVLFIFGGAFADLMKQLERRPVIGFNNQPRGGDGRLTPQQIIDFGFLPELIGRLPVLVQLDELTEDELYRVLTEPRNALVKQFRKLALVGGRKFGLGERELREIARRAAERGTGARALRSLVEEAARSELLPLDALVGTV